MFVSKDQKGKGLIFGGSWYCGTISGSFVNWSDVYPLFSSYDTSNLLVSRHLHKTLVLDRD